MHLNEKTLAGLRAAKPKVTDGVVGKLIVHGLSPNTVQVSYFYEDRNSNGMRTLWNDVEALIKPTGVKYEMYWDMDDISCDGETMNDAFGAADSAGETELWSMYQAIMLKKKDPKCEPVLMLKAEIHPEAARDKETGELLDGFAPGVKNRLEMLGTGKIHAMFFKNSMRRV